MTYLDHLLQLKSLLLILRATCVLQQHVPELRERLGRVTAVDQQSASAGIRPVRVGPGDTVSAFLQLIQPASIKVGSVAEGQR